MRIIFRRAIAIGIRPAAGAIEIAAAAVGVVIAVDAGVVAADLFGFCVAAEERIESERIARAAVATDRTVVALNAAVRACAGVVPRRPGYRCAAREFAHSGRANELNARRVVVRAVRITLARSIENGFELAGPGIARVPRRAVAVIPARADDARGRTGAEDADIPCGWQV